MENKRSKELFAEAKKYIPGGVNSPVRAYRAVGGGPLFIEKGKGSKIYDVDGNEYIDYVCSWGPLILGHSHPEVMAEVKEVLEKGTSFGAPTELEVEMAKQVITAVPSIEEVRMVSSGTEAVMSAIRLARGYTGREKIVKFEGGYHGHFDSLLAQAGSGVATLGIPGSPGVTKGAAQDTINLPFNDLEAAQEVVEAEEGKIAAIILEPVAGNMGVIPPKEDFLRALRELATEYEIILIFDEVITGFRLAYGGAQALFEVLPDLTCLGKVIGGGFPVGALGGRKEIMEKLSPAGSVYQAGTLSGNPVAMAAGLATLKILEEPQAYEELEEKSAKLGEGLREAAKIGGIPVFLTRVGSMLSLFFTTEEVYDYKTAKLTDTEKYATYFWKMLEQGVYLAPSQFETTFLSLAHSDEDIEKTIRASHKAFESLK